MKNILNGTLFLLLVTSANAADVAAVSAQAVSQASRLTQVTEYVSKGLKSIGANCKGALTYCTEKAASAKTGVVALAKKGVDQIKTFDSRHTIVGAAAVVVAATVLGIFAYKQYNKKPKPAEAA